MSVEFHVPPAEVLRLILASLPELIKLRQNECKHLCIENVAPELFQNMLRAYYADGGMTITNTELSQKFQSNGEPWNYAPGAVNMVNL